MADHAHEDHSEKHYIQIWFVLLIRVRLNLGRGYPREIDVALVLDGLEDSNGLGALDNHLLNVGRAILGNPHVDNDVPPDIFAWEWCVVVATQELADDTGLQEGSTLRAYVIVFFRGPDDSDA